MTTSSSSASAAGTLPAGDLRIARTRALRGANVWYLAPALLAEVQLGALATLDQGDVPGLLERLRGALPGTDLSSLDEAQRDPVRTHAQAAWWATLLVRVTLELRRLSGAPAAEGRLVLSAPAENRWTVAITYDHERFATEVVRQAARVVRDLLRGDDPEIRETVSALAHRHERDRPDASTQALMDAARRRGIPVRRSLDTEVVQLGLGVRQHRVLGGATEHTSMFAAHATERQERVWRMLSGVGLPVPVRDMVRSLDDALEAADDIGYPVRLVGSDADAGSGLAIAHADALRRAWGASSGRDERVVERLVKGEHVEVLVVGGRVVAAATASDSGRTECTSVLHADVRAACELAAGVVGLDVARVDLVTADVGCSLRAVHGIVAGVHPSPDLTAFGDGVQPAEAVLDMLFPAGATADIPVVSITGTNGKTTTTRLTAHLFRQTGRAVGFTTTDGVYLREQLLMQGDLTGPFAANVILSHPEVEVAVLETARGGILKSGLGFDACDVAVVMNVSADHLGLGGVDTVEQLADVKSVLPAMVKPEGCAVLNADDPLVYAMRRRTRGRVALFSTLPTGESQPVEAHLATDGLVGRVEVVEGREHLVIVDGGRRTDLGAAADVPLTFGGLARFQMQNVLAASLAAYAQGVTPAHIRQGIATFLPSTAATPGRLNLVETARGRVLLDYAHNAAAIEGLFAFVRAMPAGRRMALLSAPGDRRDDDLRAIGRLATGLDLVIMKEHAVYRRGRAPGAIAELMAEGLRATGFPAERVRTFIEERDAVAYVMSVMQPDDVVIIIADDTAAVAAQLAGMK